METNFCRQLLTSFAIEGLPDGDKPFFEVAKEAAVLADIAQKFILPTGGRVLQDPDFKALGNDIRLPFQDIALEYFEPAVFPGQVLASKRIVFASHVEDIILIIPAFFLDQDKRWAVLPAASILTKDWRYESGGIAFAKVDQRIPDDQYRDEVSVLLCFLNALSCSNVHAHAIPARKKGKSKSALPFDEYHVLTIDVPNKSVAQSGQGGTHRSPREHLRRGHIRRLQDGRAVWVNAAVIAAGRGAGKITKDYCVN